MLLWSLTVFDWRLSRAAQPCSDPAPCKIFSLKPLRRSILMPEFALPASTIMAYQRRVMISSTVRDLPEHRKKVMEACLRLGMFHPNMMEHLTASADNSLDASLTIADHADIYVGVFAFRYGHIPEGQAISITESEYDRAVERGIPRLIFLMSDDHSVKPRDVETGPGAEKLERLRGRLEKENVIGFFASADDLKAQFIQALVAYRRPDVGAFHYVADIPKPPQKYVAHPYTLLQTHALIGRRYELDLLTDWITGKELDVDGHKSPANSVRVMSLVAMGGMGKSALTWKWFNDVAPGVMKNLTGQIWWSFYESDATFENFLTRALAYVSSRSIEEVQQIPSMQQEAQLLAAISREPFLIVLDGFERMLLRYARMDAARLDDSLVGEKKRLRRTAELRVGRFLRQLARVEQSRILLSSRLYPAELETDGGDPLPGSLKLHLRGLINADALALWRAFGVGGFQEELLTVFSTFGKHPLLIQALAGEVKRYHRAPGNFDAWRRANPQFDPTLFPKLKMVIGHILDFVTRDMDEKVLTVLQTIAVFRVPANYDALASLVVEGVMSLSNQETTTVRACADESELDAALEELEDRGLVGWDRRANRYDLHPLVRGEVWGSLPENDKLQIYELLDDYFKSVPLVADQVIKSLDDLDPAILYYDTLIGLKRYDDAIDLFYEQLDHATLFRFSAPRKRESLLTVLSDYAISGHTSLMKHNRAFVLDALAATYVTAGEPARAADFYRRHNALQDELEDGENLCVGLGDLSNALRQSGRLRAAEGAARQALAISRSLENQFLEPVSLCWLGIVLSARGRVHDGETALEKTLESFAAHSRDPLRKYYAAVESMANAFLARIRLWNDDAPAARILANRAWELAKVPQYQRYVTLAGRLLGAVALALGEQREADELLTRALVDARLTGVVVEEIRALLELAELRIKEAKPGVGRRLIDDVWELVDTGPFPLFHAEAFNLLTQIERDEGNTQAAIDAATKAYRLAWCDGPPFAYHWGLEKAKQHLKELGAPQPEMPPFDESKFEPMPEVEINPRDEFHVDQESIN